jgi:hypothetical protein
MEEVCNKLNNLSKHGSFGLTARLVGTIIMLMHKVIFMVQCVKLPVCYKWFFYMLRSFILTQGTLNFIV